MIWAALYFVAGVAWAEFQGANLARTAKRHGVGPGALATATALLVLLWPAGAAVYAADILRGRRP